MPILSPFKQIGVMLKITRSQGIARRYFVVNGFDGALTMLGLVMGFYVSEEVDLSVVNSACLGVAVALGMSGLSSAYISEVAEKRKELRELEAAMVADLRASTYGEAARFLPFLIALVNGLAPLAISLLIISALWVAGNSVAVPIAPLEAALVMALAVIFMLGVYLGRISGTFWLWAGVQTLLVAIATAALILALSPH